MATTTEDMTSQSNGERQSASSGDGASRPYTRRTMAALPTVALLRRLVDDAMSLFRQEAALANSEISRAIDGMKTGVGAIAAGGAVMFGGFLSLLTAAILSLAMVVRPWLAALIVGIVVLLIGYAVLKAGQRRVDPARLRPAYTAASLSRDKEMLQNRRFR